MNQPNHEMSKRKPIIKYVFIENENCKRLRESKKPILAHKGDLVHHNGVEYVIEKVFIDLNNPIEDGRNDTDVCYFLTKIKTNSYE